MMLGNSPFVFVTAVVFRRSCCGGTLQTGSVDQVRNHTNQHHKAEGRYSPILSAPILSLLVLCKGSRLNNEGLGVAAFRPRLLRLPRRLPRPGRLRRVPLRGTPRMEAGRSIHPRERSPADGGLHPVQGRALPEEPGRQQETEGLLQVGDAQVLRVLARRLCQHYPERERAKPPEEREPLLEVQVQQRPGIRVLQPDQVHYIPGAGGALPRDSAGTVARGNFQRVHHDSPERRRPSGGGDKARILRRESHGEVQGPALPESRREGLCQLSAGRSVQERQDICISDRHSHARLPLPWAELQVQGLGQVYNRGDRLVRGGIPIYHAGAQPLPTQPPQEVRCHRGQQRGAVRGSNRQSRN